MINCFGKRKQPFQFTLKQNSSTVGDLVQLVKKVMNDNSSFNSINFLTKDGANIPFLTSIYYLLQNDVDLIINGDKYFSHFTVYKSLIHGVSNSGNLLPYQQLSSYFNTYDKIG